jgi:hypothetical protein
VQGKINTKIGNRSFENEAAFKHLGTAQTNKNQIHEEIREIKFRKCHHSVQNILSSPLLSKQIKTKIYATIIFPDFYGC